MKTYEPDGSPLDWLNVAMIMLLSKEISETEASEEDRKLLACDCIHSYMQFALTGEAILYHGSEGSKALAKRMAEVADSCAH
jgi:hypothetical protein